LPSELVNQNVTLTLAMEDNAPSKKTKLTGPVNQDAGQEDAASCADNAFLLDANRLATEPALLLERLGICEQPRDDEDLHGEAENKELSEAGRGSAFTRRDEDHACRCSLATHGCHTDAMQTLMPFPHPQPAE
jgi:hypothetical protein